MLRYTLFILLLLLTLVVNGQDTRHRKVVCDSLRATTSDSIHFQGYQIRYQLISKFEKRAKKGEKTVDADILIPDLPSHVDHHERRMLLRDIAKKESFTVVKAFKNCHTRHIAYRDKTMNEAEAAYFYSNYYGLYSAK